jgi:hypothetical protein
MGKGRRVETGALEVAGSAGVLSLETPVSELPLTAVERNALDAIGIFTLREFLDLDVRNVLRVRYRGVGTCTRLKASQAALRKRCLPGEGGDDESGLFLRKSVDELKLSSRGLHALARLHVHTVADFLTLDLRKPPLIKNCGPVTLRELAAVQRSLRRRVPSDVRSGLLKGGPGQDPELLGLAAARSQMTASSLTLLPLFSGRPLSGIRADQLHASYRAGVAISHLCRRSEREQVLTAAGIRSLGELLLTPHGRLRGPGKLTSARLVWLRNLVKEFLCGPPEHVPREVDYSTAEDFLVSLLAPVLTDGRQRRVFLDRIGWRGPRPTLAALGEEYGVSRERIRQIQKDAQRKLMHWRAEIALAPLYDFVCSLLSEHSRPLSIAFICQRLQDQYKWPRPIRRAALKKLLPAFPDLKLVGEEHVVIAKANR